MPAFVRPVLLLLCSAPLLTAQSDRRPESFQIAIGLQQRGLHDEAAGYLERFLQEYEADDGWTRSTRSMLSRIES